MKNPSDVPDISLFIPQVYASKSVMKNPYEEEQMDHGCKIYENDGNIQEHVNMNSLYQFTNVPVREVKTFTRYGYQ